MAVSDSAQEEKTEMSAECNLVLSIVARADGNFYQVLGLPNGGACKPDEVEKAFRGLAPAVHPKNSPFPEAKAAFKTIFQAFCVLSDPGRKKIYDEQGQAGLDMESLNPDIDIRDILVHGQNLKNLPPLYRKIMEAEEDLYGVISSGEVNKEAGRSLTHGDLMKYFQETESNLEVCKDIEHISTFSLCCGRLQIAWEVLSDKTMRAAYDSDEEELRKRSEIQEDPNPFGWWRGVLVVLMLLVLVYMWMGAASISRSDSGGSGKKSLSADL